MQHKTFLIHFYHASTNVIFCTLIKNTCKFPNESSVLWMYCGTFYLPRIHWYNESSECLKLLPRTLLILLSMKISIQLMCVPQWFVCKHAKSIERHRPCMYVCIYIYFLPSVQNKKFFILIFVTPSVLPSHIYLVSVKKWGCFVLWNVYSSGWDVLDKTLATITNMLQISISQTPLNCSDTIIHAWTDYCF